jgi:uroporphyrinogen decarboxylase
MTSRERIDALLHRRGVDRVALEDSPWDDTLGLWLTEGYPSTPVARAQGDKRWQEDGRQVVVQEPGLYPEPVPPWKVFGYDMAQAGGWFDWMPLRGVNDLLEETEEWEVRRNGAGGALKYWKHKSGTPEHVDFLMSSRAIWDRDYRPFLLAIDPARIDFASARSSLAEARAAGVWAHYGHLGVWEVLRSSLGDIALYENLLLDPEWIRDIVDVYTSFFIAHFDRLIDEAGMPDGIWIYDDLGYRNGLFAAPGVLDRLIFPFHRAMVEHFHGRGLPVVLHSCGSEREALPMIVEAGFDALNPMERKAEGNDPFFFAERYGEKLAFIGGFDARIFETNDIPLVRREVAAYIEGMKARGARLVFGSDHSLSPRIRLATYWAALETYREHMAWS